MPPVHSNEAAVDILQVCRDGIRFQFFGELILPRYNRPNPPASALPALEVRVQASEPPPARVDGTPWSSGMLRGDGTPWPVGQLATLAQGGNAWKRYGVTWPQNIRPLGRPTLRSTILNQRITVPFGWRLDALFPQKKEINQVCFLSELYPRQQDGDPLWGRRIGVNYCGCFTLGWTRTTDLQVNDWVAISFEGFAPNRQSADYIAQVNEGFLFRAP